MNVTAKVEYFAPGAKGGFEVFQGALDGFESYLSDWTPFFQEAAQLLEASTAEQFATQGGFGGTPWKALADSTVKSRKRGILPGLIGGKKTGYKGREGLQVLAGRQLEKSFKRGNEGHVEDMQKMSFSWGSNLRGTGGGRRDPHCIPVMHHFGKGKNPVRPILVMTDNMLDILRMSIQKFVAHGASIAGFGVEGQQTSLSFSTGGAA